MAVAGDMGFRLPCRKTPDVPPEIDDVSLGEAVLPVARLGAVSTAGTVDSLGRPERAKKAACLVKNDKWASRGGSARTTLRFWAAGSSATGDSRPAWRGRLGCRWRRGGSPPPGLVSEGAIPSRELAWGEGEHRNTRAVPTGLPGTPGRACDRPGPWFGAPKRRSSWKIPGRQCRPPGQPEERKTRRIGDSPKKGLT